VPEETERICEGSIERSGRITNDYQSVQVTTDRSATVRDSMQSSVRKGEAETNEILVQTRLTEPRLPFFLTSSSSPLAVATSQRPATVMLVLVRPRASLARA
jgi:hypothetical protein